MEWNQDVIVRLRSLWDEGHSTAEIGRRLGVTKNAVVGKAHRLDLPARPSPIRRDGTSAPRVRAPRRVCGPTLPPLACTSSPVPAAPVMRTQPREPSRPSAAPQLQVIAKPYARVVPCCWPLGEPGTPDFRFCDDGSAPGKPYCATHAQLAYVRVRDRREDAA